MKIILGLVEGTITIAPEEWARSIGEGIQNIVIVSDAGSAVLNGHSIYWMRKEGDDYLFGAASVHYSKNRINEVRVSPDGKHTDELRDDFPDLNLKDCKLGHWDGKVKEL